jgi:hypothetical protein
MKRTLIANVAALAILASSQVLAQNVSVTVTPDQRTRIKDYVIKEKVKPITMKERVTVGATLPAEVELAPVPETWGPALTRYRFVNWDNRVVLVEPSSRKVIQIIE